MRKLSVSKSLPGGPLYGALIDIKSGARYNSISVRGMVTRCAGGAIYVRARRAGAVCGARTGHAAQARRAPALRVAAPRSHLTNSTESGTKSVKSDKRQLQPVVAVSANGQSQPQAGTWRDVPPTRKLRRHLADFPELLSCINSPSY
ncbi:hypothetical protein EVAR_22112_1 [Eumeta japonica]|uniref:Uncharacterized protein n=1 Tax=Eumeta variegata TaxID=151549 RepID=A0A4C1VYW4_EUMVA|nr:hypothetical protein EVAR_22112_1 [Eumeta japonica]